MSAAHSIDDSSFQTNDARRDDVLSYLADMTESLGRMADSINHPDLARALDGIADRARRSGQ